jgi:7-carboxy-7-deazaguanine synthase (Cx14CxxC type)
MQAGRRAVFLRLSGCNLWTGRERDRARAQCTFCDTDFVGTDGVNGGRYADAEVLAAKVEEVWAGGDRRLVVITGGEPLLQLDGALIAALHERRFEIAVETNGTIAAPAGLDWICVSPKSGTQIVQRSGNELKLVWPQDGVNPDQLAGWSFDNFLIQPKDCEDQQASVAAAIAFVLDDPRWKLSLQTHKLLGLQ